MDADPGPGVRYAVKLWSAGLAGIVGTTLVFPIDLVKTRLQMLSLDRKSQVTTMVRDIAYAGQGWRALYSGLSATLIGVTPEKMIKLVANDAARDLLAKRFHCTTNDHTGRELPTMLGMLAGGFAGMAQFVVTCPMEAVKIKMQMDPGKSLLTIIREIGPVRTLYRKGGPATLLRDVPFSMLIFSLNAEFKQAIFEDTFMGHLKSGLAAGCLAAFLATPLDVIKTRVQGGRAKSIQDACKQIYTERVFFKGALQRVMIIAPQFGIALSLYEAQQRFLL